MDTQSLQAFVRVAETGSFTGAAEALFLTQPAVSKRVAHLEEQLGAKLFDRVGRRIFLTEAGRALLPRARRILLELDDSVRAIGDLSGQVSGGLRIGTSHHIGLHRLPPVLRAFSRRFPEVRIDIRFVDSEEAYEAVSQGSLELGLATLPPEPDPHTETRVIWEDPLVFMAGGDHPLLRQDTVSLGDLTAHPAILPSPATFTRGIVEALFRRHGLQPEISMATNYLETIRMMVSIGLGWSVLPATMLDSSVSALKVPDSNLSRELGLIRHPERTLSNAARAFIGILDEHRH